MNSLIQELIPNLTLLKKSKELKHGDANLYEHLINTYILLKVWRKPSYICLAGLFHSYYGTDCYDRPIINNDNRKELISSIGADAESLVYIYCSLSKGSINNAIYNNLTDKYLLNRWNNKIIKLTLNVINDIITLDLANQIECLTQSSVIDKSWVYETAKFYKNTRYIYTPDITSYCDKLFKYQCKKIE